MNFEDILKEREELYQRCLLYYIEKSKEDPRYLKTLDKLSNKKDEFMKGKTLYQVLKG